MAVCPMAQVNGRVDASAAATIADRIDGLVFMRGLDETGRHAIRSAPVA